MAEDGRLLFNTLTDFLRFVEVGITPDRFPFHHLDEEGLVGRSLESHEGVGFLLKYWQFFLLIH